MRINGKALRAVRIDRLKEQVEVAEAVWYGERSYANVENWGSNPSISKYKKIKEFLKITKKEDDLIRNK